MFAGTLAHLADCFARLAGVFARLAGAFAHLADGSAYLEPACARFGGLAAQANAFSTAVSTAERVI